MIFALCTAVTFLRLCFKAYSKANLTIRSEAVVEIGLMEIPESGRISLVVFGDLLDKVFGFRLTFLKFNAGVEIFAVFPDDHQINVFIIAPYSHIGFGGPHTGI